MVELAFFAALGGLVLGPLEVDQSLGLRDLPRPLVVLEDLGEERLVPGLGLGLQEGMFSMTRRSENCMHSLFQTSFASSSLISSRSKYGGKAPHCLIASTFMGL